MIVFLKDKLFNYIKDELIHHTVIVFTGTTIVGVFNLIYQLISVRLLTPSDYGTFNALVSLIMFVSMAVSPMGPVFVRFFTEYITRKDYGTLKSVSKELIKRIAILSIFLLLFFILFSRLLAGFVKTESSYIVICGFVIGVSLLSLIFPALFQSFQEFQIYSLISIISSFAKLVVGVLLMYLGLSVLGGLVGYLIAPLMILVMSLFIIFKVYRKNTREVEASKTISLLPIYKYFFPVAAVMFSFAILTNIDVVLVKHFFPSLDAGYYSIAQIVGKILLFLPSALAIVIFPKSTAAYVTNSHSHKILYKSLLLASILCGIGIIVCFLFPRLVLSVLTSQVNPKSIALVGLFSLVMSFYSLVWIIINYSLAIHNLKIVLPLLFIAVSEFLVIYNYHPSLTAILYILLFFSIFSFFVSISIVYFRRSNIEKDTLW